MAEIHDFISNMDEETWMGYIHAIKKFLLSKQSKVFTNQSHAERILNFVNEVLEEIEINLLFKNNFPIILNL